MSDEYDEWNHRSKYWIPGRNLYWYEKLLAGFFLVLISYAGIYLTILVMPKAGVGGPIAVWCLCGLFIGTIIMVIRAVKEGRSSYPDV